MIRIQEVNEYRFYPMDSASNDTQEKLRLSRCINCKSKLSKEVNYVLTRKGIVLWWHQIRCKPRFVSSCLIKNNKV